MKPRIAITVGPERAGDDAYWRLYVAAVELAGGEGAIISGETDPQRIESLLADYDGLLLPGGGDIDPERYGGRDIGLSQSISTDRDDLEIYAAQVAKRTHMPTLGICRGIQVMNVALGGTLYQDLLEEFVTGEGAVKIEHRQKDEPRSEPTHPVDLAAGCKLASIFGTTSVMTNSTHHQGLRRIAHDLQRVGASRDGLVEAIELRDDHPFFVGVEWHPEEMVGRDEPSRRLFRAFIESAAARAARRSPQH